MAEPAISTCSLTRRFGALVAVDGLTLEVATGEIFALLGPNGAGKTTLLKMLTTLLPPTSGRASVAGFDVARQPGRVRRVIGYVPQMLSSDGKLTGYENLLVMAKLYDVPRRERAERIRHALEFMGLTEAAGRSVGEYSGGMIRRLEIAQCMLHRPPVLFLDEPTVGLDPVARRAVWDHIERLRDEFGTTVVLTTHLMEEADRMCGRVAILHLGRVAAIGSPESLKAGLGAPDATLDDVFIRFTGADLESGGNYRDAGRVRRTAKRLG
jgi:ABC-2 type transport system ATP-binding protein